MTFTSLTGVIPPVCTPLTPDREVDVPSLLRLVDHLVAGGVHGLFVLGSSSEAAYLTDGQRRIVVESVTAHVGGQLPVLAGAIDMTTPRVLDHVASVTAAGADGVVVTAPFYARTHPAEMMCIRDSVHTKLPADVVLELAADGVVAGLKDSSGDLAAFRRVVTGARDGGVSGFSVLTGSELIVDSALAAGADGAVPGLGNVDPHGYVRLHGLCRSGDWDGARAEQERLCALFGLVTVGDPARMGPGSSALGAFKAALHLRGVIDCPVTAEPQVPLEQDEVARVGKYLAAAGLL
ncbi:dihydrodipicolinate synthase family protein [Streptomyces sp. NRRL S-481]|uniref:dihydrodipicolinate synthase family protein n=1 Tax=Streptomyces sp. NRRL S-481 TaxID=1463911 RepID=UPI0004C6177D|nr:dihydrodipicolinate synthase family protein [Streptomyces sp. NRRL S-481]